MALVIAPGVAVPGASSAHDRTAPPRQAGGDVPAVDVLVDGEQDRTVDVGDVLNGRQDGHPGRGSARRDVVPVRIVVRDSRNVVVDVGDVLSDEVFRAAADEPGPPPWSAAQGRRSLRIPVDVMVQGSQDVTITMQDVFADNVVVWSGGDVVVDNEVDERAAAEGGPGAPSSLRARRAHGPAPRFSLQVPVSIHVARSERVSVQLEDVFGDTLVAWTAGDVDISNLSGTDRRPTDRPGAGRPPTDRPRPDGPPTDRRPTDRPRADRPGPVPVAAPTASVDVPVAITVEESSSVTVALEDIASDDVLGATAADATVSNARRAGPAAAPWPGLTLRAPLTVDIRDSTGVDVDVEDIAGDNVVVASTGPADVSNLTGRAAVHTVPRPRVVTDVPVDLDVARSTDVEIDIEDVVGDAVHSAAGGAAVISNLTAPVPGLGAGQTRFSVRAPFSVGVVDSRRVVVDVEDIAGDVVVSASGGPAQVSNLMRRGGPAATGTVVVVDAPVDLTVSGSEEVQLDIEDVVGDDDVIATPGPATISNLTTSADSGRRDTTAGAARSGDLRVRAPVVIEVVDSTSVTIDIEDVFGDNDIALVPSGDRRVRVSVLVPLAVAVRGSDEVTIRIAAVASGNDLELCAPQGGEPSTLDRPGVHELPCGVLALWTDVRQDVAPDASDVTVTVGRFLQDNTVSGRTGPAPRGTATGTPTAPSAAPPLAYDGAQPPAPGRFRLQVEPGPRLAADPDALAAVERAARRWEASLEDPVTVTVHVELGGLPAGVVAQTRTTDHEVGYPTARDALTADARDELDPATSFDDSLTLELPDTLEARTPEGVRLSGRIALVPANAKALGFGDPNGDDPDASIALATSGSYDLESAVLHEIGHALGFVSVVDAVNAGATLVSPSPLDLYRFPAGGEGDPARADDFRTFSRALVPGEAAVLDFVDEAHPVASGEHRGWFTGTDGDQARHWAHEDGAEAPAAAMQPQVDGERTLSLTCRDLRAMDLVGYEVNGCG